MILISQNKLYAHTQPKIAALIHLIQVKMVKEIWENSLFLQKKITLQIQECSLSSNDNESYPENEYDDADKNDKKTQKMTNVTNGKTWLSMEKKF